MVVSGTALRLVRNVVTLFESSSPSQYSKPNSHFYSYQLIAARKSSAVLFFLAEDEQIVRRLASKIALQLVRTR